jgi:hypothetical protein
MTLALVIVVPVAILQRQLYLFLAFNAALHRRGNTLNYCAQIPAGPSLKGGRRVALGESRSDLSEA